MNLQNLGEFGLINRVTADSVVTPAHVVYGVGDDCAVTRTDGEDVLLVTTDLLVERVHFLRDQITARQLGAKAMAANLSDIAAMGGAARDAYVSIAIPPDVEVETLDGIATGLKQMAGRFGVNILGGDTTGSKTDLVLNIAVIGVAPDDQVLYRHGAQVGDSLFVSGPLGDARAGLDIILNGLRDRDSNARELARRHLEPVPHLAVARKIAETGLAHAMIDVSDGLAADLGHICEQSEVGCEVNQAALPISEPLGRFTADPLPYCLGGGEDYVLLVAADARLAEVLPDVGLVEIGAIVSGSERYLRNGDEVVPLPVTGWEHLRRP